MVIKNHTISRHKQLPFLRNTHSCPSPDKVFTNSVIQVSSFPSSEYYCKAKISSAIFKLSCNCCTCFEFQFPPLEIESNRTSRNERIPSCFRNRANFVYLWVMKYLVILFCKWMEKHWINTGSIVQTCQLQFPSECDISLVILLAFLPEQINSTARGKMLCSSCTTVSFQQKCFSELLLSIRIAVTHWNQHG